MDRDEIARLVETGIGGAYEMPDGRSFWIDGATAREATRRVVALLPTPPPDVKALIERLRKGVQWSERSIADSLERANAAMLQAADALERTGWRPTREQIARAMCRARCNPSCGCTIGWRNYLIEADAVLALKPEAE